MSFASRLDEAQATYGRICVGIDPHGPILTQWGLGDTVGGLRQFARIMTETFAGQVASVKPQVAFFERFGSAGLAVLEELMGSFRQAGTLVIADAKRGDIGSTMAGYADAWLGSGPLEADAVTVSPYLGVGALAPAFDKLGEDKGIFVLALTSNEDGRPIQGAGDPVVAQRVLSELGQWNARLGHGSIGAVIGATAGPRLAEWKIDVSVLGGPVLAPGVGAQGATVADAEAVACGQSLIIPISRGILKAGPDPDRLMDAYSKGGL